jgi:anaerobic selenocysteine-containing dehydrogenase
VAELHYRACHLCEAICGVVVEHEGDRVLSVRGDDDDPFSRGHICPKALGLADLHHDPDRLKRPLRRRGRDFEEIGWDDAFDEVSERIRDVQRRHGRDAVAHYVGNPVAHNYGSTLYAMGFLPAALGSRARFSSQSVDNLPRMLVSYLTFGSQALIPVPDVDRTMHLLIVGANPLVSNGSVMTAPGIGRRLEELRARGGKIVVIDPRRTETARVADEHHFVVPGTDALLLLALLSVLFAEKLARPGRLESLCEGLDEVRALCARFPPERVSAATGVPSETIRRIARELAAAERAVVYGRMGISAQTFGALCTWLIDLLNVVTGNLDRVGGAMFTTPAIDVVKLAGLGGQHGHFDTFRSRVRALPEFNGELPSSTLAEEIDTDQSVRAARGSDLPRVRALLTSCGNPVLSLPNGRRLEAALPTLDLMVSIDIYQNETTRHAHYILPPTFGLEHEHYDLALHAVAVRNTARWSPPLFERGPDQRHDWEIYFELATRLDESLVRSTAMRVGRRLMTPESLVGWLLRFGPYGRGLNPFGEGLDLEKLKNAPHGIDYGPLQPERLPDLIVHPSKKLDLSPTVLVADVARLEATLDEGAAKRPANGELLLIGRRTLRSNNSWMHNAQRLVKGRDRCTLRMHPDDARERGLSNGARVRIRSRVGEVDAPLEIDEEMMRGVVSLPHGFGHGRPDTRLSVAREHPGVSANDLTDDGLVDSLCGQGALNGVPVHVERLAPT